MFTSEDDNEFCEKCRNILPPVGIKDNVTCYVCKEVFPAQSSRKLEYVIHFNSTQNANIANTKVTEQSLGPVTERVCPKCNHNEMSYATVQLRSADEGQTVFYTCTKCKYTEAENS